MEEMIKTLMEHPTFLVPVAFSGLVLFFTIRAWRRGSVDSGVMLQKLGFRMIKPLQVKYSSTSGAGVVPRFTGEYEGEYQGHAAGYRTGKKAVSSYISGAGTEAYSHGAEVWLQLDFTCPTLSITERWDDFAPPIADHLVGAPELQTGDPTFDRRFSVRCADVPWAQALLGEGLRRALMEAPFVLVILRGDEALFSLSLAMRWEVTRRLGLSINRGERPVARADLFLAVLAAVAKAAEEQRGRQSQPIPPPPAPATQGPAPVSVLTSRYVRIWLMVVAIVFTLMMGRGLLAMLG